MKSIKPGRGPSMMSGFGSLFSVVFGIFWTFMAAQMEAPSIFPIFGILFICMGIGTAIYNFKNASSENRYSIYDITEEGEEVDPLNARFLKPDRPQTDNRAGKYCPCCGTPSESDHRFCHNCGKSIQ